VENDSHAMPGLPLSTIVTVLQSKTREPNYSEIHITDLNECMYATCIKRQKLATTTKLCVRS
jgi:hypothetical protein